MVVLNQLTAALAGFATLAAAVPTNPPRKQFTVNQSARTRAQGKTVNLPGMYAQALNKYHAQVPQHVQAAAERGSAVTKPEQNDVEYLTPVDVGGTTMELDFDTGSADL